MEEKLTYTSAYNAGVLTAYNMGIINGDEFEELLIDVVPVPRLYEIIFDKTGNNGDKFQKYVGLHAITFVAPKNEKQIPDKISAIDRYHTLLGEYFKGISIKKNENSIEVIMLNCPYESVCGRAGFCIRKEAIEAVTEIMTGGQKLDINVKKEEREINKVTYTICKLKYEREDIKLFKIIEDEIKNHKVEDVVEKEIKEYAEIISFFNGFENSETPSFEDILKENLNK